MSDSPNTDDVTERPAEARAGIDERHMRRSATVASVLMSISLLAAQYLYWFVDEELGYRVATGGAVLGLAFALSVAMNRWR